MLDTIFEITGIKEEQSTHGGIFYYIFMKNLNDGLSYKAYLDPKLRNFEKWKGKVYVGNQLKNIKTKDSEKRYVNSDSDPIVVLDKKTQEITFREAISDLERFEKGNFFCKVVFEAINPNAIVLLFSNFEALMSVYNEKFIGYEGYILTMHELREMTKDDNYSKILKILKFQFGGLIIEKQKLYANIIGMIESKKRFYL